MSKTSPKDIDDDDTWHQFSDAGYSSASVNFDNEQEKDIQVNSEEEWFDGDDFEFEGKTLDWN